MVVRAKVCELTDGLLWFVCGLYLGILTSPLKMERFVAFCVQGHSLSTANLLADPFQFSHVVYI